MERPTGVTVLAILGFIGAACAILVALALFFAGAVGMAGLGARRPATGMMLAGLGAFGGVIALVVAALYFIVGIGLWKLLPWGRILALVLVALGLVFAALGLFSALFHFRILLTFWRLIAIAIDCWILWYLTRPHVKQAFGQ